MASLCYGQTKYQLTDTVVVKDLPASFGNVINEIPKGELISVTGYQDKYWAIRYKNKLGYIPEALLKVTPPLQKLISLHLAAHPAIKIKKYTTVELGMQKYELGSLLGSPNHVNRTVTEYGTHEQWVYDNGVKNKYFYFDDGVLTAMQD